MSAGERGELHVYLDWLIEAVERYEVDGAPDRMRDLVASALFLRGPATTVQAFLRRARRTWRAALPAMADWSRSRIEADWERT